MSLAGQPAVDDFPSGMLVTTGSGDHSHRTILFANEYFSSEFHIPLQHLIHQPLSALFSRASCVMFDSYMLPMLLHEHRCSEMLLYLRDSGGQRYPVLVNASLREAQGKRLIYWSIMNATERNKLYQELIDMRQQLEERSETLLDLATRDDLTGLLNRRELVRRMKMLCAQAQRTGHRLAVLLIDLDHFKDINDAFGHAEGDRLLAQLGQLFNSEIREADTVARYGGEEFVVVLTHANEEEASYCAARLHGLAARLKVNGEPLTLSIGISLSEVGKACTAAALFDQADRAMYQAKSAGRNATVLFNHVP